MQVTLPYDINHLLIKKEHFLHRSFVHGIGHSIRVSIFSSLIGEKTGYLRKGQIASVAALFHDLARSSDGDDQVHGVVAVETILPQFEEEIKTLGFSEEDITEMKTAIKWHCLTWNYMNCGSNDAFMQEYAKAFRIMYNGIKSENANANVYTCIDHQWARSEASYYISGKEFLTKLNNIIKSEGNIDWRVAQHPYNAPLYAPNAWETGSKVSHSQSTPYVTVANIDVLTDFLASPDMLSPTGAVRTVKCSEVGYSSANGEPLQAASLVYAYMVAENNRYIDGIVISRESDDVGDIAQGMLSGLCNLDGSHKMGYDFYKNATSPDIIAQASSAAGVDLTSLITPR